jgi:hypothetical protein
MKKLILSLALVAFAIGAQAVDKKDPKAKDACCDAAKATEAKSAGCAAKGATCKTTPTKKALLSPKHAGEARS